MGKTVIELVLPAVSLITFAMQSNNFLPEGPNCSVDGSAQETVIATAIVCYLIFPLGYTYTVHFGSSLVLNLSNKRNRETKEIVKEKVKNYFDWVTGRKIRSEQKVCLFSIQCGPL